MQSFCALQCTAIPLTLKPKCTLCRAVPCHAADACIGEPIMVEGATWDVNQDYETAYVQCDGPYGDNYYARPKLGYTKQIGGYCHLMCEVSKAMAVILAAK
jgi:hypothetical protein